MTAYLLTNTLDGRLDGLALTKDKTAATLLVVGGKHVDLSAFPKARGIFKCGVGTDNLPFDEARTRNVTIRMPSDATQDVIYEETASFSVHLVLQALYTGAGEFASWSKAPRTMLSRRKVLVIGTGRIGRRVADKLAPLVRVSTYDVLTHRAEDLPALLADADAVTLHIPLTPGTKGWFGREKLALMPDGAALINTARAPIVPEAELEAELATGRLRAAFDVFWQEPYSGPLTRFAPDRFLRTPHVASTCEDFLDGLAGDLRAFAKELQTC